MTCIIGIKQRGNVLIGGDSAFSNTYTISTLLDQKVFRNGNALFGCVGELRMMVLLRYALKLPLYSPEKDLMEYMVLDFINAVRSCFKEAGFAEKEKEREQGGRFLVGMEGRLFYVGDDYQVGEPSDIYYCMGSGDEVASGAMHVACQMELPPKQCIELALAAATYHTKSVRGPFQVISSSSHEEGRTHAHQ